jgi:hypothetical protein
MTQQPTPLPARKAARIVSFSAQHLLALSVTVAAACAAWTILYFALLLWALLTNGGIGSPLAYPAGLLFVALATAVTSFVLLLPSTALAAWIAHRSRLPIFAQIPLSVGALALLSKIAVGIASRMGAMPALNGTPISFGVLFLVLLLPLGVYWFAMQSVPLLLSLLRRLRGAVGR